jgi:cell wall-associated NlpC family hydrolase
MRRLIIALIAVALALTVVAVEAPVAVEARAKPRSDGDQIVKLVRSHMGKRFRMGSEGMRYFDCSGLVYRVYQQAGLVKKIGGSRMLAAQYYRWFRARGLVSKGNGKAGDLVFWRKGGRIHHIGIYVGHGVAVSALINPWGVRKHSLRGIGQKFAGYGHVKISR